MLSCLYFPGALSTLDFECHCGLQSQQDHVNLSRPPQALVSLTIHQANDSGLLPFDWDTKEDADIDMACDGLFGDNLSYICPNTKSDEFFFIPHVN